MEPTLEKGLHNVPGEILALHVLKVSPIPSHSALSSWRPLIQPKTQNNCFNVLISSYLLGSVHLLISCGHYSN